MKYPNSKMKKTKHLEIGESIEEKMRRVTQNNEPIENAAPLIYTERKDGVLPQYDIRTDRFDVAMEAIDKITSSKIAQRESATQTITEETKV